MGSAALRCAAKSLEIALDTLPELKNYTAPSPTTIKRWVQKVGFFKLTRLKVKATDWMVIIDASIQMGENKCVLVLGCRKSDLPRNRALVLEDLEILALRIVSSLNAVLITQILEEVALLVGKIECVCSDRGSEIVRGVKNFQVSSPKTRHVSDTAHRVSNLLEATLEKKPRWTKFRDLVTLSRRKMQNSLVAGALPPSPRTKARYMNVDSLIKWAADMLILLDKGFLSPNLDHSELKKYLSWLKDYREDIEHWNRLVAIGAKAREIVRVEGIHMNIMDHFEQTLSSLPLSSRELKFVDELSAFLLEQSRGLKAGECCIGSTEVLESLFGKLKYMEQEQTAFGFTSLVLAAMACVGPTDEKIIKEAIKTIKFSVMDKWVTKEIPKSIQSQRRSIKKLISKLTVKMGPKPSGILEREAVGF